MRTPPRGAVARDAVIGQPMLTKGVDQGQYATAIPVPIDAAMMDQGQAHFDSYCAPCHGVLGDGRSIVGDRMELRRPPSIVNQEARTLPPGRVMEVITDGYGFMRSYASDLTVQERWAVVAYLEALQLSQGGVALDDLPAKDRAEAEEKLR